MSMVITERYGNKLLVLDGKGKVIGCWIDEKHYYPKEFTDDVKELVKQRDHARSLKRRIGI